MSISSTLFGITSPSKPQPPDAGKSPGFSAADQSENADTSAEPGISDVNASIPDADSQAVSILAQAPTLAAQPVSQNAKSSTSDSLVFPEFADDANRHDKSSEIPALRPDSSAQYEVNVRHYANYGDAQDSDYSPETERQLKYAARTPFGRFLIDLPMVLTQPSAFWKQQALHPATLAQVHFPHLTVLIILRAIASFVGMLSTQTAATSLAMAISQSAFILVMVYLMALLISGLTTLSGSAVGFDKSLRFAGYSITPILITGILSIIPNPYVPIICDIIAMPWAFLVIGSGMLSFMNVKPERAPGLTGLFCGLLLCLWSLFPIVLPYFIHIIHT